MDELDELRGHWNFLESIVGKGNVDEVQVLLALLPDDPFRNSHDYLDYHLVMTALRKKHIDVALFLIDNGYRVYNPNKSQKIDTPLHYIVELGDVSHVHKVLYLGGANDIATKNRSGKTPIHLAIDRSQTAMIELFLLFFAPVNLKNQCLLYYAVKKRESDIVDILLSKGFSSTEKNRKNKTPFCAAIRNHDSRILNLLWSSYDFKNFSLFNYESIALTYIASITGNIDFLKKSVDNGFPINRPIVSLPNDWSALSHFNGYTILLLAVEHVHLEVVKFLLEKGVDFTVKNANNLCALSLAIKKEIDYVWKNKLECENNSKIIEEIQRAGIRMNAQLSNEDRQFFFHITCLRDQPELLEFFLQNGCQVNHSHNVPIHPYSDYFPLHIAVMRGFKRNIEILLKHGANVNQEGSQKMTPLHLASKGSSVEILVLLLEHGANIFNKNDFGNTPIHCAFIAKQYVILDTLLSVKTVRNSNPVNVVGITHFHIACTRNNANTVEDFIKSGISVDLCVPIDSTINYSDYNDVTDWYGFSPLHFAVSFNNWKIVRLLLNNRANVEITDARGLTALHVACRYDYTKFEVLIQNTLKNEKAYNQSKEQIGSKRRNMKIIDWSANRKDHIKIINSLIKHKSNVNCLDQFGNGPLFYACHLKLNEITNVIVPKADLVTLLDKISPSFAKEMDIRRKLIFNILFSAHANPNQCFNHSSILHYICSNVLMPDETKIELAELFLQNGTDVNAKNNKMQCPLHLAVKAMSEKLVMLFFNYSADVNSIDSKNRSPLHIATKHAICIESARMIKLLLTKNPSINIKQSNGATPLHNLVSQNWSDYPDSEAVFLSLTERGADINSLDANGRTPLFMACAQQNEAVDYLITYGADINIEDYHGRNVLYYVYKVQAKPSHLAQPFLDDSLINMLETIYHHLIKLTTMGIYVTNQTLQYRAKLRVILKHNLVDFLDEDEREKIAECNQEIEQMKVIKIDSQNSLYDIAFKDETSMTRFIRNKVLSNIVHSSDFFNKFPIYANFFKRKCTMALFRCLIMPYAVYVLFSLSNFDLPEICYENIFKYLNNFELKDFVETCSLSLIQEQPKKNHMPLRTRRNNGKYPRVN